MHEAIPAGKDFDKGAEIFERDDATFVGLADFNIPGQSGNEFFGASHGGAGIGVDANGAVVLNIDLRACFGADAFDGFPAGSDEEADLILRDFEHFDLGGVGGELGAMSGQDGAHEFEDVMPSFGGAVDGVLKQAEGEAGKF